MKPLVPGSVNFKDSGHNGILLSKGNYKASKLHLPIGVDLHLSFSFGKYLWATYTMKSNAKVQANSMKKHEHTR